MERFSPISGATSPMVPNSCKVNKLHSIFIRITYNRPPPASGFSIISDSGWTAFTACQFCSYPLFVPAFVLIFQHSAYRFRPSPSSALHLEHSYWGITIRCEIPFIQLSFGNFTVIVPFSVGRINFLLSESFRQIMKRVNAAFFRNDSKRTQKYIFRNIFTRTAHLKHLIQ